jgi:hypothetical protein
MYATIGDVMSQHMESTYYLNNGNVILPGTAAIFNPSDVVYSTANTVVEPTGQQFFYIGTAPLPANNGIRTVTPVDFEQRARITTLKYIGGFLLMTATGPETGPELFADGGAADGTPGLVHLTDEAGLAGINQSGSIVGRNGVFAVPDYVAGQSTAMKVARTGLTPSRTTQFAPVPQSAQALFQRPVPIGPYSAWKYFGGVRYAPPGSINMATGAFSPISSLIGPSTLIYGPDVLFYGGAATAGGFYLYSGGGQ